MSCRPGLATPGLPKADSRQQLADWWDSFDSRYMRPYFSKPDEESPTATTGHFLFLSQRRACWRCSRCLSNVINFAFQTKTENNVCILLGRQYSDGALAS